METNLLKKGYITKEDRMSVDSIVLNKAYGYEDVLGNYDRKRDCTSTIKQIYNKGGMENEAFSIWSLYRGITYDSDINLNQYNYITHPTTGEILYNPQGWEKFNHMNEFTDEETLAKSVFHLNTYIQIPCYNVRESNVGIDSDYRISTINGIKRLIQEYGAITTAYDGTHSKATYNGEDESPSITTHGYTRDLHDHAVCIVGWDDDYNKNNDKYSDKSEPTVSQRAWLIKQSNGTELYYTDARTGERKCTRTGYMWLPYNELSMSGVIMCAADFDKADRYSNMYTYDGIFDISFFNESDYNTSVTIFTANGNNDGTAETIDGIMLGSKGGAEYTLSVWLNPEVIDGKLNGIKVSEISGTIPYGEALNGMFTIDLVKENKSVLVQEGQKFAIVLQSEEMQTSTPCMKEGVCYFGNDMDKFEDVATLGRYGYYPHVRALINPAKESAICAESIVLSDTTLNLKENESKQITATVYPENATFKTCGFSSSDTSVATVDEDGTVNAVGYGKAIIKVMSQDGKASAECEVNVGAYALDLELKLKLNKIAARWPA